MKVICISGKARHGKDTVASYMNDILTQEGYKVLVIHYADLLKYICKNIFHWNGIKDESGRKLLQYVGTDIIRKKNPNFWVDFVIHILQMFCDEWDYVLIPDCRFPNEIECLKENGFDTYTIRIERLNYESELSQEQQNHPSETALDHYKFDYYIYNRTLHELHCTVKFFLDDIKCGAR